MSGLEPSYSDLLMLWNNIYRDIGVFNQNSVGFFS